jgi:steroid delta-isomerase-like uncharacterized protein
VKKLLWILPFTLILCFMIGCQDKEAMTELDAFKAQAVLEEQNREVVKRYIETLNAGDFETFKGLLSPDYAIYSPSGYPEPSSREKLIENYQEARKAFPEFTWSIEDMIASGDKVICRIIIRGIYKGGVPDLQEGEKKFEFSLITIMRLQNGKVAEEWQEDDQLGFARQLGMELKPKEAEKYP